MDMAGPYILGLTGGIGQGKSTVAQNITRHLGIRVIDSDKIVHALYRPGGGAVEPIRGAFPLAIRDHGVDRAALAALLKEAPDALEMLENIVHPLVKQEKIRELVIAARNNERVVVMDVPLMFETQSDQMCDAVMVVTADRHVQRARVMKRPGMTTEKFEMLLGRQMDEEERRRRADYIVRTDTSLEETMKCVASIVKDVEDKPRLAFQGILDRKDKQSESQ